MGCAHLIGIKARAVHPGIDFEPGPQAAWRERRAFDRCDLLRLVNDNPKAKLLRLDKLSVVEAPFEQQDRAFDATFAQLDRFLGESDSVTIGDVCERHCAAQGAVSVGVGLDDGERAPAMQPTRQLIIVAKSPQINQGVGGPGHAPTVTGRTARCWSDLL